jgi:hypothetical protein
VIDARHEERALSEALEAEVWTLLVPQPRYKGIGDTIVQ